MRPGSGSVLAIALLSLAACGGGGSNALRVGMEAKYDPFEFVDPATKEFAGFDVDLAREIGRSLGRPVEFKDMEFDALIPELQAGRIDLICSGMSYTAERAQIVDFAKPYAQSPMSVLVNTASERKIERAEQLNDPLVHIAVQRATTGATKAKAAFPKADFREFGDEAGAGAEVGTGRVDAFVYDYLSIAKYAKLYPKTTRILDDTLGAEDYCIAVRKGSDLRAKIDGFLVDARKPGGAIERLMDKWLPGAREKLKPK